MKGLKSYGVILAGIGIVLMAGGCSGSSPSEDRSSSAVAAERETSGVLEQEGESGGIAPKRT